MSAKSRMFARAVLLVSAACSLLACGSAGPDADAKSVSAAISGGQPDSKDSNVFILVSHRTQGVALCSASLIAPNLLLTARHCVADVTSEQVTCGKTQAGAAFPANTFFAANAASVENVTSTFAASSVSVPSEGVDICGFDIALITLNGVVPATVATPLIPRIDRAVMAGEVYSAVGYGQTSPGDAGIVGQRRGRAGLKINCAPGGCTTGVESDEFVGDTGICSGDSGGPALDADGKVVGVVSRSADNCNHPVYGSVASWKDWITSVAKEAAATGNYDPPFWVVSGSSDAPSLQTGAGGASDGAAGSPAVSSGPQGDKCSLTIPCSSGYGCYSPTQSDNDAYCAAFCTDQTQCSTDTRCDIAGSGVCIASAPIPHSSSSGTSSSCAVSSAGRLGYSANALALAGLALLTFARRRRPR